MMKVLVTLVRVGREECARSRFRFFEEVPGGVREGEDMIPQHIASTIPKYSGSANAEVLALIVREMLLQVILVTHSPLLSGHFLRLRSKLHPPLLGGFPSLRSRCGGHHALLYDFEFFARRVAQGFCSRSDSGQLVL